MAHLQASRGGRRLTLSIFSQRSHSPEIVSCQRGKGVRKCSFSPCKAEQGPGADCFQQQLGLALGAFTQSGETLSMTENDAAKLIRERISITPQRVVLAKAIMLDASTKDCQSNWLVD